MKHLHAIMLFLAVVSVPVSATLGQEIDIRSTTRSTDTKTGREHHNILRETLNINYRDLINYRTKFRVNTNLEYEWDDDERHSTLRPSTTFSLSNPRGYRVNAFYSNYEDQNFLNASSTLHSKDINIDATIDPKGWPRIFLSFEKDESKDELAIHSTDLSSITREIRVNDEFGPFTLTLAREEQESHNRATGVTTANLSTVEGVATDDGGFVYVLDSGNNRILRYAEDGTLISIFGSFGSAPGYFNNPRGIVVSGPFLFVADTGNNRVQKLAKSGEFFLEWGSAGAGNGQFNQPVGISADGTGIYVADSGNDRIQKFDANGNFLFAFGVTGAGNGQFSSPTGVESDGMRVYVADTNNHRIQRFDTAGAFQLAFGSFGAGNGQFNAPEGVTVDDAGFVFVADTGNHRIQRFTSGGIFLNSFGSLGTALALFNAPSDVAVDSGNRVIIADTDNRRLQVFSRTGEFLRDFGDFAVRNTKIVTNRVSDTFALSFLYNRSKYYDVTVNQTIESTETNTQGTSRTLDRFVSRNGTYQLRIHPIKRLTFLSSYSLDSSETSNQSFVDRLWSRTNTNSENRATTLSVIADPTDRTNLSYTRTQDLSKGRTDGVRSEPLESRTETFNLSFAPLKRLTVDTSLTKNESIVDRIKTSTSETQTITTNMRIYKDVNLSLSYNLNTSEDTATAEETETKTTTGTLSLRPWDGWDITLSDTITRSAVHAPLVSTTTSGSDNITARLTRRFNRNASLALTSNYVRPTTTEGPGNGTLTYSANFNWRWRNKYDWDLAYSGGRDDETLEVVSTSLGIRMKRDIRIRLIHELTLTGRETKGDRVTTLEFEKLF